MKKIVTNSFRIQNCMNEAEVLQDKKTYLIKEFVSCLNQREVSKLEHSTLRYMIFDVANVIIQLI